MKPELAKRLSTKRRIAGTTADNSAVDSDATSTVAKADNPVDPPETIAAVSASGTPDTADVTDSIPVSGATPAEDPASAAQVMDEEQVKESNEARDGELTTQANVPTEAAVPKDSAKEQPASLKSKGKAIDPKLKTVAGVSGPARTKSLPAKTNKPALQSQKTTPVRASGGGALAAGATSTEKPHRLGSGSMSGAAKTPPSTTSKMKPTSPNGTDATKSPAGAQKSVKGGTAAADTAARVSKGGTKPAQGAGGAVAAIRKTLSDVAKQKAAAADAVAAVDGEADDKPAADNAADAVADRKFRKTSSSVGGTSPSAGNSRKLLAAGSKGSIGGIASAPNSRKLVTVPSSGSMKSSSARKLRKTDSTGPATPGDTAKPVDSSADTLSTPTPKKTAASKAGSHSASRSPAKMRRTASGDADKQVTPKASAAHDTEIPAAAKPSGTGSDRPKSGKQAPGKTSASPAAATTKAPAAKAAAAAPKAKRPKSATTNGAAAAGPPSPTTLATAKTNSLKRRAAAGAAPKVTDTNEVQEVHPDKVQQQGLPPLQYGK